MALLAMAAPILPGKADQWQQLKAQLMGPRRDAYEASRWRIGVQEHSFLQRTPMGDLLILVWEGADVPGAMAKLASSKDPFDEWMVQQALEIHGMDLRQLGSMPMPEPGPATRRG
jgi:hypothetical protein